MTEVFIQANTRRSGKYRPNLDYLPCDETAHAIAHKSDEPASLWAAAAILFFQSLNVEAQVGAILAHSPCKQKRQIAVNVHVGATFRAWKFPTFTPSKIFAGAISAFSRQPAEQQAEWIAEVHVFVTQAVRQTSPD